MLATIKRISVALLWMIAFYRYLYLRRRAWSILAATFDCVCCLQEEVKQTFQCTSLSKFPNFRYAESGSRT